MSDVFKGLPRRVWVGAMSFRVVITSHKDSDGDLDEDSYGSCNFHKSIIYVLDTLDLQTAFNTVLHEVKHAIHHAQELGEDSSEEEFTSRGTNGLIEFWMRNPRFYTWQTKAMRLLRKEAAGD